MDRLNITFVIFQSLIMLNCSVLFAAEPPVVGFDVATAIVCREIRPSHDAKRAGARKLVEAVFRISASVEAGKEQDLKGLIYTISGTKEQNRISITEFLPKTELYTDIVNPLVVIESTGTEVAGSLGATYRTIPTPIDVIEAQGRGEGKLASRSSVQYHKLAPKSLLLASGTKDRRLTVFYKLRPSTQTTLEGERVFSVIFEVPVNWSAGWVYVKCEADGIKRGMISALDSNIKSGLGGFSVGLYLEDNDAAQTAAEILAAEQQKLFDALAEARKKAESNKTSWNVAAWEWYWFLTKLSPAAGASASNAELMDRLAQNPSNVDGQIPVAVKERLDAVKEARRQLERLSGAP